ncbi:hypothetical protein EBL26_05705 [Escherichia coli]|nr:hypothetical protein [Escherichia coli]
MKRQIASLLIVLIITIGLPSFLAWRPDQFLISTLYSVCGIMFSIGLGLIVTFNMSGIKNINYVKVIRKELVSIRNSFLRFFTLSTLCLVLSEYLKEYEFSFEFKSLMLKFSPSILFFTLIIYAIVFFIVNFLNVQKLSHDIFDKINQEQ